MPRILVPLLVWCLLSAAGVVVATPAAACSCAGIPSAAESFAAADAVFSGRLVSREVHHPNWPLISSSDPAVHVFAVDQVFKGVVHEDQGVVSADSGASCGLELSGEGPFVVYATGSGTGLTAGLCDGVTTVTPVLESELRALTREAGGGAAPLDGAAGTDPPGPPTYGLAAGGALVLLLVIGGVLLRRRRRTVR